MNPTARICPACQQPLPADAPQGLCPQCLAKSALGSQAGTGETLASGSKPGTAGPAAIQSEIARLFPHLEILEPLGQGGMGMVYKARQPQLDRIVALKVMRADLSRDPAFAERFAREARALARLNHPNIVSVFDFGQNGGHCWILMEFVDGTNLRELLRTKTLQPREALGIVPKVCDALQYAHDEGIVHRDIKPENILLDKKGRVKIADFGLAKLMGKDASDFSLTATGMTLGTPRYMAPEQFDKPQEVDHRADIYSLGVVLYEMLTGEVPMGRFAPPSATIGVDVRLDEVVLRTLEKEPSRRYQHASEVKTQVETISGLVANLPPQMRQAFGFEYKSKTEWFGLPLVHITSGTDLQTGKRRVAKGILAIGDVAKGVFAFGGAAYGAFAFGGFAVGGFTCAGCGIGLFSYGGLALGLVGAYGGLAVAPVALGGLAAGYYACGGAAFGAHAVGGNANDPQAREFFHWFQSAGKYLNISNLLLMAISFAVAFGGIAWGRRHATPPSGTPAAPPAPPAGGDVRGKLQVAAIGLLLAGIVDAVAGMIWIGASIGTLSEAVEHSAPVGWAVFSLLTSLGSVALVYYTIGSALFLLHRDDDGDITFPLIMAAIAPPGCIFGLPAAIYALVLLSKPEVKAMFPKSPPESEPAVTKTGPPPGQPDFHQQDAREILALVMAVLSVLSVVGVVAGVVGLARVLFPALRADMAATESLRLDGFEFAGMLGLSLMALFLLPKAKRQGRARLAQINALNLIIVGTLLMSAARRHWFGPEVPYWLGGIFSVAALACWLVLRGKDVSAAIRTPVEVSSSGPSAPFDHRVSEAFAVGLPGWFHRRAPWLRKLIQGVLTLAMTFATAVFLGFNIHSTTEVTAGQMVGNKGTIQIGSLSPWFTVDFGSTNHGFGIHWFSASLWIGLAGLALGCLSERLRRSAPGFDEVADRRKRRIWLGVLIVVGVLYVAGITVNGLIMSGTIGKAARLGTERATDGVTYLDGHTSIVKALGISPDGRTLASAGLDGRLILRDLPGGKLRRIAINSSHPASAPLYKLRCLAMSPNGALAVIGGDLKGQLLTVDFNNTNPTEPPLNTIDVPNESGSTIDKLMVYDGGNKLAYITIRDAEIVFYDLKEKRIVAKVPINAGKPSHAGRFATSPDGRFLAITTANLVPAPNDPATLNSTAPYKLTVFDTSGGERLTWEFADFADYLHAQIVFSDARTFAVCLPSGKMERWTLGPGSQWRSAGEAVRIAPGRYVTSAASRDGKTIWLAENRRVDGVDAVTGKSVALIELNIGERRGEFADNPIQAIAAAQEAETIAVALWDGRVALAKCHRFAEAAASPVSANPYTFAGLPAPFVKGADGPELGAPFVKQMGFTPLQLAELNKTFQSYYREFLSLERRHTEVSLMTNGHVVVKISAFPEESLALARRMAQELRGLIGKDVIPVPQPGRLVNIGLFRHAGEASLTVELWKAGDFYHFKEERVGAPNAGQVNEGAKTGRSTSGDKLHEVIPEEYRVYWKE